MTPIAHTTILRNPIEVHHRGEWMKVYFEIEYDTDSYIEGDQAIGEFYIVSPERQYISWEKVQFSDAENASIEAHLEDEGNCAEIARLAIRELEGETDTQFLINKARRSRRQALNNIHKP